MQFFSNLSESHDAQVSRGMNQINKGRLVPIGVIIKLARQGFVRLEYGVER
jgi:predicted transcriptional regulator